MGVELTEEEQKFLDGLNATETSNKTTEEEQNFLDELNGVKKKGKTFLQDASISGTKAISKTISEEPQKTDFPTITLSKEDLGLSEPSNKNGIKVISKDFKLPNIKEQDKADWTGNVIIPKIDYKKQSETIKNIQSNIDENFDEIKTKDITAVKDAIYQKTLNNTQSYYIAEQSEKYIDQKVLDEKVLDAEIKEVPSDFQDVFDNINTINNEKLLGKDLALEVETTKEDLIPQSKINRDYLNYLREYDNDTYLNALEGRYANSKQSGYKFYLKSLDHQKNIIDAKLRSKIIDQQEYALYKTDLNKKFADKLDRFPLFKKELEDRKVSQKQVDKEYEDALKQSIDTNPVVSAWGSTKLAYHTVVRPALRTAGQFGLDVLSTGGRMAAIGNPNSRAINNLIDNINKSAFEENSDAIFKAPSQLKGNLFNGKEGLNPQLLLPKTSETLAQMFLLVYGGGEIAKGLEGIGVVSKAGPNIGLFLSSYASTQNGYYMDAVEVMGHDKATQYSILASSFTSSLELLSPNKVLLTGSMKKTFGKNILKSINNGLSIKESVIINGKALANEISKEEVQEASQEVADNKINYVFNAYTGSDLKTSTSIDGWKELGLLTFLGTAGVSFRGIKGRNQLREESFYEASNNIDDFKDFLKRDGTSEFITKEESGEILKEVERYGEIIKILPKKLNERQKSKIALAILDKKFLEEEKAKKENLPSVVVEEDIKEIDNAIIEVDNSIQDEIDKKEPKKEDIPKEKVVPEQKNVQTPKETKINDSGITIQYTQKRKGKEQTITYNNVKTKEVLQKDKNGNTLHNSDDGYVSLNKDGKALSGATTKKLVQDYQQVYDFHKGEISTPTEDLSIEEVDRTIAEKSKNPNQLAELIQRREDVKKDLDRESDTTIEGAIAQVVTNKSLSPESYMRITGLKRKDIHSGIKLFYFKKGGDPLDILAMTANEMFRGNKNDAEGIYITEQDIVDFIEKYPNTNRDYFKEFAKDNILEDAKDNFRALTGFEPTISTIKTALGSKLLIAESDNRNYTDEELKVISEIQEESIKEFEEYINSKTEEEQNEILDYYEGINEATVSENTEGNKSKNSISDKGKVKTEQDTKTKRPELNDVITSVIEIWKGEPIPKQELKKAVSKALDGDIDGAINLLKETEWHKDMSEDRAKAFEYDFRESLGEDMAKKERPKIPKEEKEYTKTEKRTEIKTHIANIKAGIIEGKKVSKEEFKKVRKNLNDYINVTLKEFILSKRSSNKMRTLIKNVDKSNYGKLLEKVDDEFKKLEEEDRKKTIEKIKQFVSDPKTIMSKKGKNKKAKVGFKVQEYLENFDTSNLDKMSREEVKDIYNTLKSVVNEGKKETKSLERIVNAENRRKKAKVFEALHKKEETFTVSGKENLEEALSDKDTYAIINGQLITSKSALKESEQEMGDRMIKASDLDAFLKENPDVMLHNIKIYKTKSKSITKENIKNKSFKDKVLRFFNPVYNTANLSLNLFRLGKGSRVLRKIKEKLVKDILKTEIELKNNVISIQKIYADTVTKIFKENGFKASFRLNEEAPIDIHSSLDGNLSNSQIVDIYLMSKTDEGIDVLLNDKVKVDVINEYINREENKDLKEYAEYVSDFYKELGERYGSVYEKITGLKFKEGTYYPLYREGSLEDMFDTANILDKDMNVNATTPFAKSMIARVNNNRSLDITLGSHEKLMHYIESMERVKQFTPIAEQVNIIFNKATIPKIIEKVGTQQFSTIIDHLSGAITGIDPRKKSVPNSFGKLINTFMAFKVFSALGFKTASVPTQYMSFAHFMTSFEVTPKEWLKAAYTPPTSKKEIEVLKGFSKDEYVINRFKGKGIDIEANRLMESKGKLSNLAKQSVKSSMIFIRIGDVAAIIRGGSALSLAIYRKEIEKGTSHEDAKKIAYKKAAIESETAQQSTLYSQTSMMQRDEVGRMFTAFKTAQIAAKNKMVESALVLMDNDSGLSKEEKAKHRFNVMYYAGSNIMFSAMRRGFTKSVLAYLFLGGSSEDKEEIKKEAGNVMIDNAQSILDGIGIEGWILNSMINNARGDSWKNEIPVIQEIVGTGRKATTLIQFLTELAINGKDWDELTDKQRKDIKTILPVSGLFKQFDSWKKTFKGEKSVLDALLNLPTKEEKKEWKKNSWLYNMFEYGEGKKPKYKNLDTGGNYR